MDGQKVDVLLIRKGQTGHSPLSNRLARRGCECRFATSNQEAGILLAKNDCDLILGPVRLDGESLFPLIGQLRGSRTTLFYYLIVEDGCWWLPAVWLGANCFGAPAIHNSDFATVLDETIEHLRLRARVACRVSERPLAFPFPAKYRSLYQRREPKFHTSRDEELRGSKGGCLKANTGLKDRCQSCRTTPRSDALTCSPPLYLMNLVRML